MILSLLNRKQLNVFRLRLLPLFFVSLAILLLIPSAYAGLFFGYTSANVVVQCPTSGNAHCSGSSTSTIGAGLTIQSPVTGTLVSILIHTSSADTKPDRVVISLFTTGVLPNRNNPSCTNDGTHTCPFDTSGQSGYTVKDVENLPALTSGADNTVVLGNPVATTSGTWISITFLNSGGGLPILQTCDTNCGSGGSSVINGAVADTALNFGSLNPSVGSTPLTSGQTGGCGCIIGGSFNAQSSSGATVTQCYGNCGTPPITLANTNSTKSINFNQSITLFYEFQSNLNGIILNSSLNYANFCGSGNKCTVNTLFIAIYLVGNCPSTQQPFSNACPASRLSQSTYSPPGKARLFSICTSICQVSNGQWVGIAVSATFSGIEINDTNTNVPLFQTNGMTPVSISSSSSASSLCGGCKMGLWAWLQGNVVTGPSPTTPTIANCGNGIGDYIVCLTLSFCTGTPNAGCQIAGGIFWAFAYSAFAIVMVKAIDFKLSPKDENGHASMLIPNQVYYFVPIAINFMFVSLGVLPVWWAILLFMIFTALFANLLLGIVHGDKG